MASAVQTRSEVLWHLRSVLRGHGFSEIHTPALRANDDRTGQRIPAGREGSKSLRSMIGPALRFHLQHAKRIYEIGPCFRLDEPDATHAQEFSMLDLYAADEDYSFLGALAAELVGPPLGIPTIRRVSVAAEVLKRTGVDLRQDAAELLVRHLRGTTDYPVGMKDHQVIDQFVEAEVEPVGGSEVVMLHDYPLGGSEPCARRTPGTAAVLNRFELFARGLELVHGYEDEPCRADFMERAKAAGLYNKEQEIVYDLASAGKIPVNSVGLGIGIERLCMAAAEGLDASDFMRSSPF